MLTMDGRPLARTDPGKNRQVQMHQKTDYGVKFQPAMGFCPVQKNRCAEHRHLHDDKSDDGHPEIMHSNSSRDMRKKRASTDALPYSDKNQPPTRSFVNLCKRSGSVRSGQQHVGERHSDPSIGDAHNAIRSGRPAFGRDAPSPVFPGVNHPNVRHAELEVIVDPVLHARHSVIGRHDFDAKVRRRREHLFVGNRKFCHDNIRNPNSCCRDPKTKSNERLQEERTLALTKPRRDLSLGEACLLSASFLSRTSPLTKSRSGRKLVRRYPPPGLRLLMSSHRS